MNKKRGFSFLDLIVTLGLFSIFSLLVFPLLKISNTLNTSIIKQSLAEKEGTKLLSLIESSIENGNIIKDSYLGKEYIKNGILILQYEREIAYNLKESFFSNSVSKGNTLFIEYPVSEGKNIFSYFIIFHFFGGELSVMECKKSFNEVFVENRSIILKNIHGSFEKTEEGVIIEASIINNDFSKNWGLKGYANFKKEIKR